MVAFTGKYISILHRQEQKAINRALRQYDLGYSCYNFLLYISTCEGCSQKQLCRHMYMDEALATRVLKKLEQQGFIRRQKDKNNGRALSLSLTPAGQELIPVIRGALEEWWSALTDTLDQEQALMFTNQVKDMAERALLQNQQVCDLQDTEGERT